jgi:CHRD domain
MGKVVRRIVAVVAVTAATAFGVYALVDILPVASPNPATASSAGSVSAPSSAPARASSSSAAPVLLTCPVTGCQFSTCHGATGAPPPSRSQRETTPGSATSSSGQGSPQAASVGASQKTTPAGGTYAASLVGAQVVPSVRTTATATVTFTRASSGTVLRYVLRVRGIRNPTVARLHEGVAGANGPALATLFAGPAKSGIFTGTLASGTLRATSLGGPLAGKQLTDLLSLIKAGRVYVLLGTTQHLAGEVRGEIKVSAA